MSDCQQYVHFWGGPWHHEYHWWNVCQGPQVKVAWPPMRPTCGYNNTWPMDYAVTQMDVASYDLRRRCRYSGAGNCTWIAECVRGCDEPK